MATYEATFGAAMIVVTTAAAVLTTAAAALAWRSVPRGLAAAGAYAVLTLCCGALAVNRYDAVVALTVAAALLFLALRRALGAGLSLGLGFALKLTPALLLPLLLVLQESRRRVVVDQRRVSARRRPARSFRSCSTTRAQWRTRSPSTRTGRSSWRACWGRPGPRPRSLARPAPR